MAKLVVSQFMTLDGVVEDPGGSENLDRGGWAFKFNRGDDVDQFKSDELEAAGSLLLGRGRCATSPAFEAPPSRR